MTQSGGFDVTSTHYCDTCQLTINVGFGGEANWRLHEASKKHQDRMAKMNHPVAHPTLTQSCLTGFLVSRNNASRPQTTVPGKMPLVVLLQESEGVRFGSAQGLFNK
jgi:hypothetical protein